MLFFASLSLDRASNNIPTISSQASEDCHLHPTGHFGVRSHSVPLQLPRLPAEPPEDQEQDSDSNKDILHHTEEDHHGDSTGQSTIIRIL